VGIKIENLRSSYFWQLAATLFLTKILKFQIEFKMASMAPYTLARFAEKAFLKQGIKVTLVLTVIPICQFKQASRSEEP